MLEEGIQQTMLDDPQLHATNRYILTRDGNALHIVGALPVWQFLHYLRKGFKVVVSRNRGKDDCCPNSESALGSNS